MGDHFSQKSLMQFSNAMNLYRLIITEIDIVFQFRINSVKIWFDLD